ncbi:hypothetical protein QE152_g26847 [Popillia japonica]|uniref:Uncharacterized protein n=1 Tax=Popillia japonica TaxID=7064 RepID=A0AAW1JWL6_POPJA
MVEKKIALAKHQYGFRSDRLWDRLRRCSKTKEGTQEISWGQDVVTNLALNVTNLALNVTDDGKNNHISFINENIGEDQ